MLTIENNILVKCDENATEVVIPADITKIESTAFKECKSLKTLRFPKDFDFEYLYDNLNPYDMRDYSNTYYGTVETFFIDSLTDVYYEGSIADWIKATGYLFFKENVKIHCSDGDAAPITPNMEKIVIPNGVTEIPDYAFFGYSCKEIEIPDTVTIIGQFALCNTCNLKSITLPASLGNIYNNAFENSGIENINFKGTTEQWKKVYKDKPWGSSNEIWWMEVGTVHCSDGDTAFDDLLYIRDNWIVEVRYYYDGQYSIPIGIEEISANAFSGIDNYCELNYEGTKKQWFKIDKGENWDGDIVSVVHCSDGDVQIK
ncbi:MAG: leucine-rich repeat domain-containing protein [Treponema sp.]|nr:leucine-rich repeat domain-containing protein [Treponema sp.]